MSKTWKPPYKAHLSHEAGGWTASIEVPLKRGRKTELATIRGHHALDPLAASLRLCEWLAQFVVDKKKALALAESEEADD